MENNELLIERPPSSTNIEKEKNLNKEINKRRSRRGHSQGQMN